MCFSVLFNPVLKTKLAYTIMKAVFINHIFAHIS